MFVRVQRLPISTSVIQPLLAFEHELDKVFEESLPTVFARSHRHHPAIDIAEYKNESVVVAELPGVRKEDIKLSVEDGILTIAGDRKATQLPENSSWIRHEISTGEFTREIQLPHEVKEEGISAELTDGVLRIVLPKADEARPREIKVR